MYRKAVGMMVVAALLAALGVAGPASAGVVHVRQCAGAGNDLMSADADKSFLQVFSCSGAATAAIISTGSAGASPGQGSRTLTITAPGATTFVGGRLQRQMTGYRFSGKDDVQSSWAFGYRLGDAKGSTIESCGYTGTPGIGDCTQAGDGTTRLASDSVALPGYPTDSFAVTVGCMVAGACYHYFDNPGVNGLAADLLVRDDTPPSPTVVDGPLKTASPVTAADATIDLGAEDSGGLGVYDARLLVDNVVTQAEVFSANGGSCVDADPSEGATWLSGHPCPLTAATRAFEFDALPEGMHNIKLQIRDAGLNESLVLNRNVMIDRIAAPTAQTAPALSGTPRVKRTLVADKGQWDEHGRATAYSYRWLRCDAAGDGCQDTGVSAQLYDVADADVGRTLVAEVQAASDQGATRARSLPSGIVASDGSAGIEVPVLPGGGTIGSGFGDDGRGSRNGVNASDDARLRAYFSATRTARLRARYGSRPVIRGTLTDASGAPISNARIELLSRIAGKGSHSVDKGGARTRADGGWTLILPRDVSSRTLTLRYRSHLGDATPAATAVLHLLVRAGVTLQVTPRSTHNHGTIRFSGRVLGHSVPAGGKLVELQARAKGHGGWITFKTLRSTRGGAYHSRYTFHASRSVTYEFRSRVRRESGYPFLAGSSRRVSVHVR